MRRQVDPIRWTHEQQYRAPHAVGVDLKLDLLARLVFALVGDQLDVVEAEVRAVKPLAHHREQIGAFDLVTLSIRQLVRQPILTGGRGLKLLRCRPLSVRVQIPRANLALHRLVLGVRHLVQRQLTLALDRLVVQRVGVKMRTHRVPDTIVATVHPGKNLEWLSRDLHRALAHDRPPRLVHHLRHKLILMVFVRVQFLGDRRIDLHRDLPVRADRNFHVGDFLGRLVALAPPPRDWTHATPLFPARIPGRVVAKPPIAPTIEPIPRCQRVPTLAVARAQHLVLHLGLRHRRAKEILGLDRSRDLFAQHHRFRRRRHRDLVLRLLVFLHAEAAAALVHHKNLVHPQLRIHR